MKISELQLLFPKRRFTEDCSIRIIKEFIALIGIYFLFHLIYTYSHESALIDIIPENSRLQKMVSFPGASFISIILLFFFILFTCLNRKLCLWILGENRRDFSKIFTLEILSTSVIVVQLLLLLLFGLFAEIKGKMTILESIIYLIINIFIIVFFSFLYIKRNILYSYYYLGQDKRRAFLVLLIPITFMYIVMRFIN